jgi:outer membrane biosynthesis protein TonB
MRRNGVDFTPEAAQDSQLIKPAGQRQLVDLNHGDFVTLDLGNSVALHLRYVENARFFIRRTWLENREEFVKAMSISLVLHAIASIVLVVTAPKTVAPHIENVPPRFAKLLVEPPPMPFAPPKPEPIPEPVPEPVPQPVVEAKPVPRKPEPQRKPVKQVKKTHEKPKPEKIVQKPVPKQPVAPQPVPEKVVPPKPSASEVAANELMDVFSKVPSPASSGGNKAIKIDRSVAANQGPAGQPGLSTLGVSGALKAKGGKLQAGGGVAGGVSTAKAGQFGYSNTPAGSKAGKRGVAGGVVGTPRLDDFSVSTNGLSDKEIMSVVNKYLSQVNRCYERALLNDSNIAGRVQYEWDITPQGKVTSVRIKRSEISNGDSLNSCVMLLFKAMKFPAAKNKQPTTATIGFPFGKEG